MAYSKILAKKYATNRNKYKSSDKMLLPFLKKAGIKNKTILDFGCGDGPETEKFLQMKAKKVVGVDPSSEMIRLAKLRKLNGATFIKTNGKKLPLKSNEFDLVYSRFVLHYIKDLKSQFVEISRVLKSKGYFLALFQSLTDNSKFTNKTVPVVLGKDKNATNIKILSKSIDVIKHELTKAGLKVIKSIEVQNTDAHIDTKYE
ncbi:MAG: class I SAM-dependent methyltransferase, partial [Parcubacteria group bacterium]